MNILILPLNLLCKS